MLAAEGPGCGWVGSLSHSSMLPAVLLHGPNNHAATDKASLERACSLLGETFWCPFAVVHGCLAPHLRIAQLLFCAEKLAQQHVQCTTSVVSPRPMWSIMLPIWHCVLFCVLTPALSCRLACVLVVAVWMGLADLGSPRSYVAREGCQCLESLSVLTTWFAVGVAWEQWQLKKGGKGS